MSGVSPEKVPPLLLHPPTLNYSLNRPASPPDASPKLRAPEPRIPPSAALFMREISLAAPAFANSQFDCRRWFTAEARSAQREERSQAGPNIQREVQFTVRGLTRLYSRFLSVLRASAVNAGCPTLEPRR